MINKKKPRILIIKIAAIGDVALALPLIEAFEEASLTWLCGNAAAPLLHATHKISKILTLDENKLLNGHFFQKLKELLKIWILLLGKTFDQVIIAHKDPRYKLLALSCFKKRISTFSNTHPFPLTKRFHSLEYLDLIEEKKSLRYPPLHLPSISHLITIPGEHLILLTLGGHTEKGKHLRIWPAKHYALLAQLLIKDGYSVALVGTKEEPLDVFNSLPVINLLGKTSLLELIALMQLAFGCVTHDSGSLHLARLASCRICALFGPTSSSDFSFPSEKETSLSGGLTLPCSPCYKREGFPSCSHQKCLQDLSAEVVFAHLKTTWNLGV